jgi:hypothetical protein
MSKKSKNVDIVESITIPLIGQEFLFIYNVKNLKKLKTHFDKDKHKILDKVFEDYDSTPNSVDGYVEQYTDKNENYYLSLVLKKSNNILTTLVHEIVHIMQHVREKFFLNNMEVEFEAYITEWIFKELHALLKENKVL